MPDIQFFDASGFFAQKVCEVEHALIAKKAELEILLANRSNLESTITSLGQLSAEHQKAIQSELASLKEVLNSVERTIAVLEGEIEILTGKLSALIAAQNLLPVRENS